MAATSTHRKSRAFRLTDEALALLRVRLAEEAERGNRGRLTRPLKAELMDVSITTAERILAQKGNDRAVLVHALERLGIPWNDHLEPVGQEEEPGDACASPEPGRPGRHLWRIVVATAAVLSVTAALVAFASQRLNGGVPSTLDSDRRTLPRTLTAARVAYDQADYETAARQAADAFRIAQRHRLADAMADCLRLEGDVLAAQGHLEQAAGRYRNALSLWGSLEGAPDVDHGLACVLGSYAVIEARLGRLDEAEEQFHRALVLCQKLDDQHMAASAMRGLGSVEAVRGNVGAARRWYDAAALALKNRPNPAFRRDLRALRALLLRDEGQLDASLSELEACLAEWREGAHPRWIATTLLQVASVHHLAGRPARVAEAAVEANRLYSEVGDRKGVEICDAWVEQPVAPVPHPHQRAEEYF